MNARSLMLAVSLVLAALLVACGGDVAGAQNEPAPPGEGAGLVETLPAPAPRPLPSCGVPTDAICVIADIVDVHDGEGSSPYAPAERVAIDATHVYWTSLSGALLRQKKDGGTSEVVLDAGAYAFDLAVDGTAVY